MEYKKINELTAVVTGGTPSTRKNEYWDNGDIPWLQSGCCQNCDVDSTEKYITKEGYNNSSTHMMPADTVMIALTGATAGKVGYLKFEACGNQSITGILPCESLNQRYLFFYLLSQREKILADCVGGAQAHISQSYVKNMTIPILAIKEQEQIVGELTKLSNIVSLRQEEIQQLDALIKARFVEMFGDYINEGGKPLSELATITGGLTKNSKRNTFNLKMPYLRVANVFFNRLDLNEILEIGVREDEIGKTLLEAGDLLFVEGNGSIEQIGRVAIWDGSINQILHQNHLIKARFHKKTILPEYALFYFMSQEGRQQIISKSVSTSGLNTLSVNKISSLILPMPPIELQERFAAFVTQVNKSKVAVQKALDETQILFDSLMQKYFG